jgi:hypothetical protein
MRGGTLIGLVVLQNCMGFVEGETVSCNETLVKCDVDGTEEVGIKFEEAIDIKDEIPSIKTEQEVRLWGVCEVVAAYAFRSLPQKVNCEITLNYFLLCVMF